jgi:23S rRNA (cytidine1920-2'-O)/16S rRNA (cytidine1409-2'-O)-methyltransferase
MYVSRGGDKLAAVLERFKVNVTGSICADFGSHVGGFVDCLLQHGAARVYSVDTCYGTLAWKLRRDPRVVVRERCNAMHVTLPEPVDTVTIDVGWTAQAKILPSAATLLGESPGRTSAACTALDASVITLIKPHYEAPGELLVDGILPDEVVDEVVDGVLQTIIAAGWTVCGTFPSPLRGHAGNCEVFALLTRP